MKQILLIIWIAVGCLLLSFIGVKNHPEENHRMIIVKHRPSLKLEFYSPLGGTNKLFEELSPKEQKEEELYREFIKRPQARTIDNMALVFYQFGIYIIVLCLLRLIFFRRKFQFRIMRFLSFNAVGLAIAMGIYQIYWAKGIELWAAVTIQVIVCMLMIYPRLKKNV